MDIRICLLLAAEAGLALVLLWSAGVLRKPAHVLCAALLLAAAFVLRGLCLNYETERLHAVSDRVGQLFPHARRARRAAGVLLAIIMYRT